MSSTPSTDARRHRQRPHATAGRERPLVVVCVDGCEPDYINQAIAAGARAVPRVAARAAAPASPPTAWCRRSPIPNNLSIVTGAPPSVHGICGNYFWDRDAGAEVMMNDPKYLRAGTILAAFADAGAKVAVVTAKDKLRALLGHKMTGICFSSEKADQATRQRNGIDGVARADRHAAAVGLQRGAVRVRVRRRASQLHGARAARRHVPVDDRLRAAQGRAGHAGAANDFYAMMDRYLARLDALGATVVVTADHGMNAKTDAFGRPNVVFLQDVLDARFGAGATRVILPITDPYVVHHGALGSFATVYCIDARRRRGASQRGSPLCRASRPC